MSFLKRLGLWFSVLIFGLGVSIFVVAITLTLTIGNRESVKSWLTEGEVYTNVVKAFSDTEVILQNGQGTVSIKEAELFSQAAAAAYTPEVLDSWAEHLLDGTYDWLEGKTDVPQISIDTREIIGLYADSVATLFKDRYEANPVCSTPDEIIAAQSNILAANCQIDSIDIDEQITLVRDAVLDNPGFFGEGVYTAENITLPSPDGGPSEPLFERIAAAPKWYQLALKLPLASALLIVVGAAGIIFLSKSKLIGVRRISHRFITGGIFGAISVIILIFGARALSGIEASSPEEELARDIVIPFMDAAVADFVIINVIISGVMLILGIVGVVVVRRYFKPVLTDVKPGPADDKQLPPDPTRK